MIIRNNEIRNNAPVSYGGRREGLIRLEKAGQEGEVAESHSEM